MDGFHELLSVVAPLDFCDHLHVDLPPRSANASARFTLTCAQPDLPTDATNLVLRAAQAFANATGWPGGAHFRLEKRIPVGAGLGGGSSNAVSALLALNHLNGGLLSQSQLPAVAATLGSDCTLFLYPGPTVMRGRGEHIARLPPSAAARLRGRRVLLFKPPFGINTAWAYARMAAEAPHHYVSAAEAEARLSAWMASDTPAEDLCFNNMQAVAFAKFPALPMLLDALSEEFGLAACMSGSGSACFALLRPEHSTQTVAAITARIRELWGETAFVTETKIS